MFNYSTGSLPFFLCVVFADRSRPESGHVRRFHAELDEHGSLKIVHDSFKARAVAWASFKDATLEDGWAYLNVETNPQFPDYLTAYAAGALEAHATRSLMRNHEKNRYADFCRRFEVSHVTCNDVIKYLQDQVNYMFEMALTKRLKSDFWNQIYLILQQLAGLTDSYSGERLNYGNRFRPSTNMTTVVNWEGDLLDIEDIVSSIKQPIDEAEGRRSRSWRPRITGLYVRNPDRGPNADPYFSMPPGHCSALIKYINNNIYIGHTSWFFYNSMLRLQKKYNFPFRTRGDVSSPQVPGTVIVMTSYPGLVYSLDEFYLIKSGLFVTETTLDLFDPESTRHCRAESVPTWIRSMVANRLSASAKEWVDTFSQENSGTYNNQFMIVDFKKFEEAGRTITNNVLLVLEQMPGSFVSRDLSEHLRQKSFFASFNTPLFEETKQRSGSKRFDTFTNYFNYELSPRKLIFDRDHHKVDSIATMIRLMRSNDYRHDNLSVCHECDPPFSVATFAIAARGDLVETDRHPFYVFRGLIGATDVKAIDYESFKRQRIFALNGPPDEHVPPFSWSTHGLPKPAGHPDRYNFTTVFHGFERSLQTTPKGMRNRRRKLQRRLDVIGIFD